MSFITSLSPFQRASNSRPFTSPKWSGTQEFTAWAKTTLTNSTKMLSSCTKTKARWHSQSWCIKLSSTSQASHQKSHGSMKFQRHLKTCTIRWTTIQPCAWTTLRMQKRSWKNHLKSLTSTSMVWIVRSATSLGRSLASSSKASMESKKTLRVTWAT